MSPVGRCELFAWAMYDFANSGYTTVVLTTIFNVYFVSVIVGQANGASTHDNGTFLWTLTISLANALVLITAPLLGALADYRAIKKRLLLYATVGCIMATGALALVGPGDVALAVFLVVISNTLFASGENLVAAFLPEISTSHNIGKVSGYAWGLGYMGGICSLGLCLLVISWAESQSMDAQQVIPVTMLLVAALFAIAATPTFVWLKERAVPLPLKPGVCSGQVSLYRTMLDECGQSWQRLGRTFGEIACFKDLFRFLLTLVCYQSGVSAVIVLAAIYAQEVLSMSQAQIIQLVLVVNVTAAVGAVLFGLLQDSLGSVRTLAVTLVIWIIAVLQVYFANEISDMWLAGNLIGLAMGASQSAGRALIGQFTPVTRTAEFFGLWGLAGKLAAIIGPLSYGLLNYWSNGDHRLSLLSTLLFFICGLLLLMTVNEQRGKKVVASHQVD